MFYPLCQVTGDWVSFVTLSVSYFCPFKILLDFWRIGIPAWFCSGRVMCFSLYSYLSCIEHLWSSYHGDLSVFSKTWCFTSICFLALTQCGSPQWVTGLLLCTYCPWPVINRSFCRLNCDFCSPQSFINSVSSIPAFTTKWSRLVSFHGTCCWLWCHWNKFLFKESILSIKCNLCCLYMIGCVVSH